VPRIKGQFIGTKNATNDISSSTVSRGGGLSQSRFRQQQQEGGTGRGDFAGDFGQSLQGQRSQQLPWFFV